MAGRYRPGVNDSDALDLPTVGTSPNLPLGSPAPPQRGLSSRGPTRRTKIVQAAVHVLRVSGIEGLTHRAVAEQASVPLGSTTYYFSSRTELLNAAIEYATDRSINWIKEWAVTHEGQELGKVLPKMLYEYLTERRAVATFDTEIYVLAARRPEIRMHATRWSAEFTEALEMFVSSDVAKAVAAMFNGLVLTGLASTSPPTLAECAQRLSVVIPSVEHPNG